MQQSSQYSRVQKREQPDGYHAGNEGPIDKVIAILSDSDSAVNVSAAEAQAPHAPGLYAIHVDDPRYLPEPFRTLLQRGSRLLYVGQASRSIYCRLVEQELQHRRPGTFFRSIGAVLGYRPPAGSLVGKANRNNYRFSADDTAKIISWIRRHLNVQWFEADRPVLNELEQKVIQSLQPLMNSKHNTAPCAELIRLRSLCRTIACDDQ